MSTDEAFAPLAGRVVVDFSTLFPGPYAGLLLAQLGCEVIKVEPPTGDPGRHMNPNAFQHLNAGKRSITLDVKHPESAPVLRALFARADAVLVSSLPGSRTRLGLDATDVHAVNPDTIYCAVQGWSGPLRDQPAHDLDIFAATGAVALAPDTDYPLGLPFADLGTGALAAMQIAAALSGARTSRLVLEVSMASVLQSWVALGCRATTEAELRAEPRGAARIGGYGLFAAADGRRLSIGAVEDRFWRKVVHVCGLPADLADVTLPQRRARADEINTVLAARIATEPAEAWIKRLRADGVPAALVATLIEAFTADSGGDAVTIRDGRVRVGLPSGQPTPPLASAPTLGGHTDAVLTDLGLTASAAALRAAGAVS